MANELRWWRQAEGMPAWMRSDAPWSKRRWGFIISAACVLLVVTIELLTGPSALVIGPILVLGAIIGGRWWRDRPANKRS